MEIGYYGNRCKSAQFGEIIIPQIISLTHSQIFANEQPSS